MNTTTRRRRTDPTLAVAYLRCSTDEQHLSFDAQRADVLRFADAQGIAVVAWAEDFGVSGGTRTTARAGYAVALSALEQHRAGVLLVAKRDRLARDSRVAGAAELELEDLGVALVAATGSNGDDDAALVNRTIENMMAELEKRKIRARTRGALAVKKARGERVGEVPYGYRVAEDGVHLEQHQGEQAVIATVAELRAAGLSQRGIVRALAERGLASRTGNTFALVQVQRMLSNAA
jgi:DNA invertase Pin-like site-specific DNA recombinase